MDFKGFLSKIGEYGIIEQINHPIVVASGLPGARLHEIILFESGEVGEVFVIQRDMVEILVFSRSPVAKGTKITRTDTFLSVPVGNELLGSIIDPMGRNLSTQAVPHIPTEYREIDVAPLGMDRRARITKSLHVGISVIDIMIPLGQGQKELVIGNRKTGKTSFLMAAMKSQVDQGGIAIYAGIAKRKSDIKKVEEYFRRENLLDKIVIIATTSYDSPSLIYITPYSATTIAEYFRDQGKNVLLVMDDMTTHAKFYREISLLAKRFPGRDSYPGDIFHTHARLMERAGNFKIDGGGEASITMLPIAEIVEEDLTGYITTNLMSMTDGHIFFDSNVYYEGRRPAVNIPLSVTRVGRQTQTPLLRNINREIAAFLTLYDKVQNLSHFGAELSTSIKETLATGKGIYDLFNQQFTLLIPVQAQVILFALLWLDLLDRDPAKIDEYKVNILNAYKDEKNRPLFENGFKKNSFNQLLEYVNANKDQFLQVCSPKSN